MDSSTYLDTANSIPKKVNGHHELYEKYKRVLEGVFQQEYHNIGAWISGIVDDAVTIEAVEKKCAEELCLQKWPIISDVITKTFCLSGKRTWNDGMIKKFSTLIKVLPTKKEIIMWLLATIGATILELSVFLLLIFYDDSSFYTIIPAAVLAIGSLLAGWSAGKLLFLKKIKTIEDTETDEDSLGRYESIKAVIILLLGLTIVIGISILRGMKTTGNPAFAIGLTLLLALAIIVCGAMHTELSNLKARVEKLIYHIQTIYSYTEHNKMTGKGKGSWEEHYSSRVKVKISTLFSLLDQHKTKSSVS